MSFGCEWFPLKLCNIVALISLFIISHNKNFRGGPDARSINLTAQQDGERPRFLHLSILWPEWVGSSLVVPRWLTKRKIFSQKCPIDFACMSLSQNWFIYLHKSRDKLEWANYRLYLGAQEESHLPYVHSHQII